MPINEKLIIQEAASTGDASSAEGLVLHLDANDEDSIEAGGANTGAGSGTWFDIANHDLVTPLADKASNLQFHLNFSDTSSYAGTGTTFNDISGNSVSITTANVAASDFNSDVRGYFTINSNTSGERWTIPHSNDTHLTSTNGFTHEFWLYIEQNAGDDANQFFMKGNSGSAYDTYFYFHETAGWYFQVGGISSHFVHNADKLMDQFVHVAFTMSSNSNPVQKLYLNGTLVKTVSASGTVDNTSSYTTKIGSVVGDVSDITGRISNVRLYNTVLTASEVAQNFRQGNFLSYSSIYTADLDMNLDAANYTSGTWDDSVTGNSANVTDALFDKELGNFFTFDGATSAGDRIEFPHDATLNQGADISWEVWVKRDDTGIGTILNKGTASSGTFQYFFYYNSAYGYLWYSYAQGGGIYSGNAATTVGVWEHVVFTNDSSGNGKMYVNGELTTSSTLGARGAPTASVTNTNVLNIGGYDALNGNNGHDGEIGVVRFYDTALSSVQVTQNYLATKNDYPNGINGDIQGPTFQGSSTPYHFDFNGTDNYVDVPYTTLGDRDFTITMYLKFDDLSTQRYIWTKYLGNPSGQYGTLVQSQASRNDILWQMYDTGNGTPISIYSSTSLSTGTYYHLSFVYVKETSATIYLNGSADGTTSYITSNPFAQNSAQIRFGRYQSTNVSLDGEMGQIKIFDKALSASEVLAEFNATKTIYGL
jgi:hypothetical protein